jgi:LytTr DNA-binding domain
MCTRCAGIAPRRDLPESGAMNEEPHRQIRQMQAEIRERQPTAVREAPMADTIWTQVWERPWLAFALSATLPGFVLSLLGPFGSYEAPLWMRFAYWMPTMALGAGIGAALTTWSEQSSLFDRRPILRVAVLTSAMTVAMTGVAYGTGVLVFGPGAIRFGYVFVFYVWLITMVAAVVASILRARRTHRAAAPALPAPDARALALAARLPDKLKGATILALQGEDHYVRVHTDNGSDLVLLRLGDAVTEMGSTPGARTHRSWWVAKHAVKSVRRDNGRIALVLKTGTEAPISRGYAAELREAGWLDN